MGRGGAAYYDVTEATYTARLGIANSFDRVGNAP